MKKIVFGILIMLGCLVQQVPAQSSAEQQRSCPKWEAALKQHRLPVKEFSYIMWRESRCQPRVIGWNYHTGKSHVDCKKSPAETYKYCDAVRSFDVGLLQINSSWVTVTSKVCKTKWGNMFVLRNPKCNLAVAAYLYHHGGGIVNWRGSSN